LATQVQLKWLLLSCESLIGIIEPISLDSARQLLERWNTSLEINPTELSELYHLSPISLPSTLSPSPETLKIKDFLIKWIDMTTSRLKAFEEISLQYQQCLEEYDEKYQDKLLTVPSPSSAPASASAPPSSTEQQQEEEEAGEEEETLYRSQPQKRVLFEFVIELKLSLHSLQNKLKTDKRFTLLPTFQLPEKISNQINLFLSVHQILSLIPNSIVLLFSDTSTSDAAGHAHASGAGAGGDLDERSESDDDEENENKFQNSSFAGILSFDKLQKIMKIFQTNPQGEEEEGTPDSACSSASSLCVTTLLSHMKIFFELLSQQSLQWSSEVKDILPLVSTRTSIKKAAASSTTVSDVKRLLSHPLTRYIEPPGYDELHDVWNSVIQCKKDLISLLFPNGRPGHHGQSSNEDGGDGEESEGDNEKTTSLEAYRLNERWNHLHDRLDHLPIQIGGYTALATWFQEIFEWIKTLPVQVFDLVQIPPDQNTNTFNITNNSKKLNYVDKERGKCLLEAGLNFMTPSHQTTELTRFFQEMKALSSSSSLAATPPPPPAAAALSTDLHSFFQFDSKVNSLFRFLPRVVRYLSLSYQETLKYETLALSIINKITSTVKAENLDKQIDLLKKLIGKGDELLISPETTLRMSMKTLLRQLETSLWDGITLFNESKRGGNGEVDGPPLLSSSSSLTTLEDQWIPPLLKNNSMGGGSITSEELLSTISNFEEEDDEYLDDPLVNGTSVGVASDEEEEYEDDDTYMTTRGRKRRRNSKGGQRIPTLGRRSSSSDLYEHPPRQPVVVIQNCVMEDCEWPRMNNSSYCSESCAVKGCQNLFESLLSYKPIISQQLVGISRSTGQELEKQELTSSSSLLFKMEQVVDALEKGHLTSETLVNDCKVFGSRTSDNLLNSSFLSQASIDYLFPSLAAVGMTLSASLRKQVRNELQNVILSSLSRLSIPCAFASAAIIATELEKEMSQQVHQTDDENTVKNYRKKYMILSKAFKDPYNDAKIRKILFNEMSVEELLKLDTSDFDDDQKQQRKLESLNAEKKKIVPAGKSLTELLEEKRRAAEEGAESWRDGTSMDQPTLVKTTTVANTLSNLAGGGAGASGDNSKTPLSSTKKSPRPEIKVDLNKTKELLSMKADGGSTPTPTPSPQPLSKSQESPRSPRPKQVAPTITSLLQMGGLNKRSLSSSSSVSSPLLPSPEPKQGITTSNTFQHLTDVRVSTPLGPPSAHVPQGPPHPDDSPLKVLLSNQNDSEFVIHITNYPVMRETVSLVCTGGVMDCTGQGIIMSGIQNDKRYQVEALRKQLRNFKKHIPISILVLSVKEERELTERKYRYLCDMFADPQKERIPSVEFHNEQEQTFNLHLVVPQLVHHFPQLQPIVQKSLAVLPHGFWLYGILEMDREVQGPEALVRCNQVDFPVENIKFLMGKVEKLVGTIENMPSPDVNLAIERVQQTVGSQFDFMIPGHKDFQFFINQVNQRLRLKKLKEWGNGGGGNGEHEKKRKHENGEGKGREKSLRADPNRGGGTQETRNIPSPKSQNPSQQPGLSRRSSHEELLSPHSSTIASTNREPQLSRSRSDDSPRNSSSGSSSSNGVSGVMDGFDKKRKSRFN
jgi:hypothetical protein